MAKEKPRRRNPAGAQKVMSNKYPLIYQAKTADASETSSSAQRRHGANPLLAKPQARGVESPTVLPETEDRFPERVPLSCVPSRLRPSGRDKRTPRLKTLVLG